MSGYFERLEADLLDAVEREARRAPRRHTAPGWSVLARLRRRPRGTTAVLIFVVLAGGTTGALAAAGLLVGSPVRPTAPLQPGAGEGIPAPGGSRLLALRAADPLGGPPWGIQIVHTTRDFVCLQVGRVEGGRLGELGIDGAFHDDGQFHPLPPDVLPNPAIGFSVGDNAICEVAGRTAAVMAYGVDRNAAPLTPRTTPPRPYRREVSYGLLGTHALSVTYKAAHGERTTAVDRGTGVFLLVQHSADPQPGVGVFVSQGFGQRNAERPGPNGVLTAVTYRFGNLTCSDGRDPRAAPPCPRASAPSASARSNLHETLRVSLDIRHGIVFGAQLRFRAPFALTSGRESYEAELHTGACPNHSSIVGLTPVNHNLARGSTIRVKLPYVFSNSCNRSEKITVLFYRSGLPPTPQSTESTEIGSITIHEPPGTSSAELPIPRQRSG